jgi:hypothetical protein
MSKIPLILIPLLEYLIPVAVGLAIALRLFKKKITGDLVISSVSPICLWFVLVTSLGGKTLSNAFFEPLVLAASILLLEVIRLALDGREIIKDRSLGTLNIAGSLLFTLCITFFIPSLPE